MCVFNMKVRATRFRSDGEMALSAADDGGGGGKWMGKLGGHPVVEQLEIHSNLAL